MIIAFMLKLYVNERFVKLTGSLKMFNVNINISNLKNNENDMQIISNILYNDMSVLFLSVGFTLFLSLILIVNNIFYSSKRSNEQRV